MAAFARKGPKPFCVRVSYHIPHRLIFFDENILQFVRIRSLRLYNESILSLFWNQNCFHHFLMIINGKKEKISLYQNHIMFEKLFFKVVKVINKCTAVPFIDFEDTINWNLTPYFRITMIASPCKARIVLLSERSLAFFPLLIQLAKSYDWERRLIKFGNHSTLSWISMAF